MNTLELSIEGMTCASCANRIERTLNRLDGVRASVNYATEVATVETGPAFTADIVAAVEQAGYKAHATAPDPSSSETAGAADLRRRVLITAALSLPVIVLAMVPPWQFDGWQWLSLALTTPVFAWGAWPFHRAALINLRQWVATMDTLVSIGTLAAFGWSLYALLFGTAGMIGMRHGFEFGVAHATGSVYFEAVAGIVTFVLAGRYIEARAKRDAGASLRALSALAVAEVTVVRDGTETTIPIERLRVGDTFVARPGQRIATDGKVVSGSSAVDVSVITGESIPAEVGPGDEVTGSSVVLDGHLTVRATAVGADTALAWITRRVHRAQTGKAAAQRLADRISGVFVPVILFLSLCTFVAWVVVDGSVESAAIAAIAVLIIACPCALGLATPTALLVGTGRGAELGILITGPQVLETARRIDTVVLDKTGTITTGRMALVEVVGPESDEVLRRAAAVEQGSEHPIARAIVAAARGRSGALAPVEQFRALPGVGAVGMVEGTEVTVGRSHSGAVPEDLARAIDAAAQAGRTAVAVSWDGRVRGVLTVADTVRDTSANAVAALKNLGLDVVMLTGDTEAAARTVGARVGIDTVIGGVTPDGKVAAITDLREQGRRVAMAGDGINDAAALAVSDLGIALGSGTSVAMAASDITVMRGDLIGVVDAIRLSRGTLRTIDSNLFWAFAYNVAAVPVAAIGLLTPMLAGAAMALSSVFVVLNSLRLRGFTATPSPAPASRPAPTGQAAATTEPAASNS